MKHLQVDAYLERIGYSGPREPSAETLRQLHRTHILSVPFENLDIPLGHPILLSLPALYDKIVLRRRGGFCYELNGLFAWLLGQLGFPVVKLSAGVYDGTQPGPEFDHLVLLVELEVRLIADVGFGDSFLEPLQLDSKAEAVQHGRAYRLIGSKSERVLQRRRESDWESQYTFSLTPRRFAEFSPMCHFHQTSADSHFTRKATCSLSTPEGRVTLSGNRFIETIDGERRERTVENSEVYRTLLKSRFGIELGDGEPVDRLMARGTLLD